MKKRFTKSQTFSDIAIRDDLRKKAKALKKEILTPKIKWVVNNMQTMTYQEVFNEIENIRILSNKICCPTKPSYSMEEAAITSQTRCFPHLEPYICRGCGFVHFGHSDGDNFLISLLKQSELKVEVTA
jgi:hypothetical protein